MKSMHSCVQVQTNGCVCGYCESKRQKEAEEEREECVEHMKEKR